MFSQCGRNLGRKCFASSINPSSGRVGSCSPILITITPLRYCSYRYSSSNDPKRSQYDQSSNKKASMLASLGIGASLLFGKTKYVFAALKLTKAAPLASMVLSSFAYSFFYGWPYAIGMVGLIFCHECGHAVVMHR
jgi:hypothetical protein